MFKQTLRALPRRSFRNQARRFATVRATRATRWTTIAAGAAIVGGAAMYSMPALENSTKTAPNRHITAAEIAKHNTEDDCWVIINGQVYDLSKFIPSHPGGPAIIVRNAGKDVSAIFNPLHANDVLTKFLRPEQHIGIVQGDIPAEMVCAALGSNPAQEAARLDRVDNLPPLGSIMNLYDFEYVASQICTAQAWAYYSSASDDEITHRENHAAYHRIFFNPNVLVDVKEVDISTTMLGAETNFPFYASATALATLGHPDGEVGIARGCSEVGMIQMISTLAAKPFDEIADARAEGQTQWFQLYVNGDRDITDKMVKRAEEKGMKAIFVTVDAPSLGRREKDMRMKFDSDADAMKGKNVDRSKGVSAALSTFIDPSLTWADIDILRTKTNLPIVIKGIQRKEDVLKAIEHGCAGVVLSNHGGRQLDFSKAPIEVLADTMPYLKEKGLENKIEIFIDGGVRRGTDVIKALCLGAKGVGMGRPFLYANSGYGSDGVAKVSELLAEEIKTNMRMLGANKISDLTPDMVDTACLKGGRVVAVPRDTLYLDAYQGVEPTKFRDE